MNWVPGFFRRRRLYDDLAEEMRLHLEERTEQLISEGMSRKDAEQAARRAFGNRSVMEERSRVVWQWSGVENAWADLKIALRQLRKTPSFTLVALLIIALGIGASTAVFSIVDSVLLRPYAFRNPDQLIVWREVIQEAVSRYPTLPDNYRHYLYLKAHSATVADAAILQNASFAVEAGNDHPQIVKGLRVSPNFFSVLGVSPMLGRTFLPEEAQQGGDDKILITWTAWHAFFQADSSVIGRSLRIKGRQTTVIGVLPKDFEFPTVNEMPGGETGREALPYEIFQPLVPTKEEQTADDTDWSSLVVARLKQGATAKEAGGELDGMMKAYSANNHLPIHLDAVVEPFSQEVTGNISKALWLLLAAVLSLLLIACVNLASLQLARATVRDRDNALRAALGAGRIRLFQATLMESLVLSVVGGAAGILLALGGTHVLQVIAPENLPRLHQIQISWPVLVFACSVSVLVAILSGTLPALRSLRADPHRALQAASTRVANPRQAALARRILVTFEIACTVVLLIVTGLVVRSFSRVLNQHHDFNASHVTIAEVDLLNPRYEYVEGMDSHISARSSFIDRTLERLRANAGVESAAITSNMPLTGDANVYSIYRPDHPLPESELPLANLRNISPGYFAAMQTPVRIGTDFTESEREHPNSAIVSQRAARAAWPDSQPLGRRFKINGRIYTVIGIAADARIANLKEDIPVVYLPFWHDPPASVYFLIRSSQSLDALAPAIRRQIWEIDPEAAIPLIKSLDTRMAESVAPERLQTIVLSSFGLAALILSILGVYGVLAYSVSLRTPEFGIRIALGSSKIALIWLVLVEASKPVVAGMALGSLASIGATRAISSLLYETSAADPGSIGASLGLLLLATSLAAFLPAYRASKTDPMRVLREE
jgi:predicted permease